MEILFTILIIGLVFGLLSFTPLFKKNPDENVTDGEASNSEDCDSCGITGSCSTYVDKKLK